MAAPTALDQLRFYLQWERDRGRLVIAKLAKALDKKPAIVGHYLSGRVEFKAQLFDRVAAFMDQPNVSALFHHAAIIWQQEHPGTAVATDQVGSQPTGVPSGSDLVPRARMFRPDADADTLADALDQHVSRLEAGVDDAGDEAPASRPPQSTARPPHRGLRRQKSPSGRKPSSKKRAG